jgi:cytochrome c biogenesis protein CcmG/thiol:disulfide interchange protein DsbE
MNWKVLVAGLVPVAALVAVLASGFGKDPKALPSMLEGKAAPPFALETLDGKPVSLESLKGTPVVVNFWATWCRPCAMEHPVLLKAAQVYEPRGVRFLGILYGDEADKARAYLAREGQAYPTLLDPGQRTGIDYGVGGVPETFFIGRDGTIVRKYTGPIPWTDMVEILEELL